MLQHPECKEWQVWGCRGLPWNGGCPMHVPPADPHPLRLPQVLMCGLPFFILFLGNFFTTLRVVHQKFQNKNKDTKRN